MPSQAQPIITPRAARLIRKMRLLEKIPVSKSMLALWLDPDSRYYRPDFPKPTYFEGSRIPYWVEENVDAWIARTTNTAEIVPRVASAERTKAVAAPVATPVAAQDGTKLAEKTRRKKRRLNFPVSRHLKTHRDVQQEHRPKSRVIWVEFSPGLGTYQEVYDDPAPLQEAASPQPLLGTGANSEVPSVPQDCGGLSPSAAN